MTRPKPSPDGLPVKRVLMRPTKHPASRASRGKRQKEYHDYSRVEGDSGMEVMMPLECGSDSKRLPSQAQSEEARQKGLGSPFYLTEVPAGFEQR